jgi:hypothetical protein
MISVEERGSFMSDGDSCRNDMVETYAKVDVSRNEKTESMTSSVHFPWWLERQAVAKVVSGVIIVIAVQSLQIMCIAVVLMQKSSNSTYRRRYRTR